MDIQEAREAFEKRQAILVGVSYAEFKQRTDDFEKALGRRYGKKSINENEWAVWIDAWQAAKAHVPEGFVLVEIKDLRDVISNAGDAMMNEETSSVYDRTGEPSTWFDHYTVAEKRVLKAIKAQEQKG
ncbi:hypothetical protein [Acinetobacter harbinensis]|uniref:hypothetical protein n=1 Tax=Acinetobacter harbinensis TaxID=1353941 RepID=UPI001C4E9C7E|nr:hypothetical protein [Acinetobacter harbinensis]